MTDIEGREVIPTEVLLKHQSAVAEAERIFDQVKENHSIWGYTKRLTARLLGNDVARWCYDDSIAHGGHPTQAQFYSWCGRFSSITMPLALNSCRSEDEVERWTNPTLFKVAITTLVDFNVIQYLTALAFGGQLLEAGGLKLGYNLLVNVIPDALRSVRK